MTLNWNVRTHVCIMNVAILCIMWSIEIVFICMLVYLCLFFCNKKIFFFFFKYHVLFCSVITNDCFPKLLIYLIVSQSYWFIWLFPKIIDLFDCFDRFCFEIGIMLRVVLAKCEEPCICQQKNVTGAKGFHWRTDRISYLRSSDRAVMSI